MARNTIILRAPGTRNEFRGTSVYAITPGMLLELTAEDVYQPHSTAGGQAALFFAREQWENQGADVDDNIAVGDEFTVIAAQQGDVVNAYTSDTIAAGGWVESDGAGGVRAQGSGYGLGVARKASDLSGTNGRVEIVIASVGT